MQTPTKTLKYLSKASTETKYNQQLWCATTVLINKNVI